MVVAKVSAIEGVRELPPLLGFADPRSSLLRAMQRVTRSPAYVALTRDFVSWPPNSLISTHERAILHWLVGETRAKAVLEIGSYFAGTTLLLSTSMRQLGAGKVHTLDPYGQERVPGIIAGWPRALQNVTVYWPKYACDFFVPYLDVPPFDVILVDGDHSYPNVMHDLFASYENLSFGGYIVIDNAEQLEVLDGSRDFLKLTPQAEAVRLTITGVDANGDYAIELDTALERNAHSSAFVVVRKPRQASLTRRAMNFHLHNFDRLSVSRMEATIINESAEAAALICKVNLRSLPRDSIANPTPYDISETMEASVGPGRTSIAFSPKELKLMEAVSNENNFVDVSLYTSGEAEGLKLVSFDIDGHAVTPGRNFVR